MLVQVREGLDLAECPFVEQMLVFANPGQKAPWYLSDTAYWAASVLLWSWPLRMIAEWRTAHLHYQVTKLFGTNYLRYAEKFVLYLKYRFRKC